MSLPSLAEQFRQQISHVDQFCIQQEATLLVQEQAAIQQSLEQWATRHEPDVDPIVYDVEAALTLAEAQGVSWGRVVLDGLRLEAAGKRMRREVRRLEAKYRTDRLQVGVADYKQVSKGLRNREFVYIK